MSRLHSRKLQSKKITARLDFYLKTTKQIIMSKIAKSNLIILPKGKNDTALYLSLLAGGIIRLLLSLTRLPELLTDRNELTTPITSWKRCKLNLYSFYQLLAALDYKVG